VESFQELMHARTLMGLSEAFYIPAALALIAAHHTGPTRSRAVGAHQIGIYLGVIAGGFGGMVADQPSLGWRSAFTACGVFGMLYALPLVLLLRDNGSLTETDSRKAPGLVNSLPKLLLNGSFVLLVLYFTLPALAGWIVRDWMPAILRDRYGVSQGKAGVLASLPWQSAAILFAFVGGIFADRMMARTERGRILVSALGMALIVPAIFGMGIAGTIGTAVAALVLFGIGWGMFDTNNMPILCQIVPANLRATGYGIMNLVSISCGGLADWGFGKLKDQGASEPLVFGVFAALALVAGLLVLCIRPKSPEELERMAM
jgi:MFS family permease